MGMTESKKETNVNSLYYTINNTFTVASWYKIASCLWNETSIFVNSNNVTLASNLLYTCLYMLQFCLKKTKPNHRTNWYESLVNSVKYTG
jgi:hypothetical protein